MPRMEPFPRLVDFVEERILTAPRRLVRRLAPGSRRARGGVELTEDGRG